MSSAPTPPRFLALVAGFCLLWPAAAQAFDAAGVDQTAIHQLTGGSPLVVVEEHDDGRLKLVTGGVLIEATPEVVWAVITDYARYPDWMPEVEKVTVVKEEGRVADIKYDLLFKISIITRKISYTLRKISKKPTRIEWELIEGDFDDAIGGWQLVPTRNGEATMAYYSTYTNLRSMGSLIGGILKQQPALEMAIQVSTAVTVVQTLRDRVEALQAVAAGDTPPAKEQ
jgi:ribosome-associated toxin RatA of RatAB toxin-antitoxin module